jgi:hypothetical protein
LSEVGAIMDAMSSIPPVDEATADGKCCGKQSTGAGFAGEGNPRTAACALCPGSPGFWRRPENRENGQPYQPVPPLGADLPAR